MTEGSPPGVRSGPPDPHNPRRLVIVYAALAGAATLVWLVGSAAMPAVEPPPEPSLDPPEEEILTVDDLACRIWTDDMQAEHRWRYIVIHHTATHQGTLESLTRGHRERLGADDVGYHFIINNGHAGGTLDGEITPTPRWYDQRRGAHCLVSDHPEFNTDGIGICLIGHFSQYPPTPAQMASLERLVRLLRAQYDIPLEYVIGHGELKATECPGKLFPMEAFLMNLRRSAIDECLR